MNAPGIGACRKIAIDGQDICAACHIIFDALSRGSLCRLKIRANRYGEHVSAQRSLDLIVVDRCMPLIDSFLAEKKLNRFFTYSLCGCWSWPSSRCFQKAGRLRFWSFMYPGLRSHLRWAVIELLFSGLSPYPVAFVVLFTTRHTCVNLRKHMYPKALRWCLLSLYCLLQSCRRGFVRLGLNYLIIFLGLSRRAQKMTYLL